MISRFLAAIATLSILIGPADALAQKADGSGGNPKSENAAADAQDKAPLGEDAKAAPDAGPIKDPFDVAAAKMKAAEASSLGAEGEGDPARPSKAKTARATFGAGCFWHVESEFEWLPGVKSAISGYSGGVVANPSYEEVHEGVTGHAEVVQVEYDPDVISYEQLLKVFWSGHDPTQLNRQGPDEGTQYRSVIFYHSPEQREAALKSYRQLTAARVFHAPIVTQLLPMRAFYPAEEYHQNYYGGKDGRVAVRNSRTKRVKKPTTAKALATRPAAKSAATAKGTVKDVGGAAPAKKAIPRPAATSPADPES